MATIDKRGMAARLAEKLGGKRIDYERMIDAFTDEFLASVKATPVNRGLVIPGFCSFEKRNYSAKLGISPWLAYHFGDYSLIAYPAKTVVRIRMSPELRARLN